MREMLACQRVEKIATRMGHAIELPSIALRETERAHTAWALSCRATNNNAFAARGCSHGLPTRSGIIACDMAEMPAARLIRNIRRERAT